MATPVWMLEIARTYWRLHSGRDSSVAALRREFVAADIAGQAEAIRDSLTSAGHRGEPVVVALASAWSLAATVEVSRRQELRDRKTMLFRLEEHIPWSIEDCVADYLTAGTTALMVAVPAEPLAALFKKLELLSIQVQSITPWALLAAVEHLSRDDWPAQHVVAFEHGGSTDLLVVDDGKLVSWLSLPACGSTITQEIRRLATESGRALALIGYGLADSAGCPESLLSAEIIEPPLLHDETSASLAQSAATKIVRGRLRAPIELKRDQFGRRGGNPALRRYSALLKSAVAVLCLTACGALLHRGQMAKCEAEILIARQTEVFREAFPNTKVPVGIKSRLESELAKLKGLHGDDSSLPPTISAGTVLHHMLAAMPTDRRFRLLEIRIEEGRLYLDGEVIEHGDAELIVQRLRANGFEVASPRTQRLDDKRISLRISGTITSIAQLAARSSP
jgi:hypothetical protein